MIKIGHRGAMAYEPENTLRSFQRALDIGVDMVELDVQICKTGELVVMHDEHLERTSNGFGPVAEKTLAELKSLDAGQGEKIPTLKEVFDLVDKKSAINIELKGLGTALPTAQLIEKYIKEKSWQYNDFLVSSFIDQELIDFFNVNQKVPLAILSGNIELRTEINAYAINFSKEEISKSIVDKIHKLGLKVLVYTVNDKDDINKMKSWGVDGIFSNYPDKL